ncbi:TlpA family protein disulfide reductase [Ideonella sp. B7]|uniref:TlpA family protein disulfide reductase n=1 Tax=Ideonella benzenivorans TaxID=2831643 RepID=UPI001CED7CC1|nr:TlpA disulfide reductase family protein [Ideonella benzenivorans]MCA6217171.1 TlpA family protein disulfide reductase [Ideonella benzenivorans]
MTGFSLREACPDAGGDVPDRRRRQALAAVSASAVLMVLGAGTPRRAQAAPTVLRKAWPRGRATPAVDLPRLDGGRWTLASARGEAVLLHFWATWCEPCREELPRLAAMAERERAHGLQLMAVDYREPASTVRGFLKPLGLTLPVALDDDGAAAKAFEARVFPCTVGIDRQGRARFQLMGAVDWTGAEGRAVVDELLRA